MKRWTVLVRRYHRRLRRLRGDWLLPFVLAAGGGWLLAAVDWPIPWLMGPLFSSLLLAALSGRVWAFPPGLRNLSQVVLGLAVGLTLDLRSVVAAGPTLLGLTLLVIATFALNMLNGVILWRWAGVERSAALLGSVPGAASAIVAMSADFGVDARIVAVLQYLRVLFVAVMVPFLVESVFPLFPGWMPDLGAGADVGASAGLHALEGTGGISGADRVDGSAGGIGSGGDDGIGAVGGAGGEGQGASPLRSEVGDLALLVLYGLAGLWAGRLLRLPSPPFLGPFLVAVAGSHLLGVPSAVPAPVFNGALLLLGTWIGLLFDMPLVRKLGRLTVINLALLVLLVAATVALSWVYSLVGDISMATAFLANAPGAMEVVIAASIKLGADTPLVVSVQMIRFLVTLFLGAPIARRVATPQGGAAGDGSAEQDRVSATAPRP